MPYRAKPHKTFAPLARVTRLAFADACIGTHLHRPDFRHYTGSDPVGTEMGDHVGTLCHGGM